MSAITAALTQIDEVAADGDLVARPRRAARARDGRRADPAARRQADLPAVPARPADRRARPRAARHGRPGAVELPAADRPARRGQEPDRPRDRLPPLDRIAADDVTDRHGVPFYGFVELQPGPSSDEFFFRYDYVPLAGAGGQVQAGRLGVRAGDARGVGGDDRRGQHRPRRRAAVDQRHPRRAALAVSRGDGRDRRRPARVRRPAGLQPRAWSARPTSRTRGTRGSRRRSRSRATGPRSRSSARRPRS